MATVVHDGNTKYYNRSGWILKEGISHLQVKQSRNRQRSVREDPYPSLQSLSLRAFARDLPMYAAVLGVNALGDILTESVPADIAAELSSHIFFGKDDEEDDEGRCRHLALEAIMQHSDLNGLCLRGLTGKAEEVLMRLAVPKIDPMIAPSDMFSTESSPCAPFWEDHLLNDDDDDENNNGIHYRLPVLPMEASHRLLSLRRLELSDAPSLPLHVLCGSVFSCRPGSMLTHLCLAHSLNSSTGPALLLREEGWVGDRNHDAHNGKAGRVCYFLPDTLEVIDISGCTW
eukprot:CAMPEP_0113304754 /NCGR_PEP_ID=MMETSP0010_2-20120614/4641_1 /TAXON_ID=216773 ORGANISM="Corethron hystrix, Strain 308" /NCGR_SAMPLE_ID=MMETSP0010_2 /ASSEMBLY_ACC=CAM_ASM_000155 /LENGTH=286 /DNA_ID=CAMNT_0000159009 /DNA_START=416 /DNA_END=1273 /DNA_ORIENTATION=+ /assembly_acc=CAM_ASM_000155